MKTKDNQFAYNWIYYLLVVVISCISWIVAFDIYHLPKDYESIKLFYAGNIKDYSFQEIALKNNDLVSFELLSSNPADNTFKTKYNVVGFHGSDVLIVDIDVANSTACSEVFVELNDNYGLEFFSQQGANYGLMLTASMKNNLSSYFEFEQKDYVITVSANSVNAGTITNKAFDFVKWMVSYEI